MALPGQPLQVCGGSKRTRHRNPADGRASKRGEHAPCDGRSATRPLTSGERLWGATSTSSLYCSETDKDIFGISFEWTENESEAASQYQAAQLSTAKKLKRCGVAKLHVIKVLLEPYQVRPWRRGQGRKLQLRYGHAASMVATDGVFRDPDADSVIAYTDFAELQNRKETHIIALLQKAEGEKKETTGRIAEEQRRIKPNKAAEDAQIALIMAAMAQEMLRSGEPNQLSAWVRVIGRSKTEIFLYIPSLGSEKICGNIRRECGVRHTVSKRFIK
ncbi:hypothetical protein BBAD15_g12054 [Beauveria bassiana D1-5]|uniref:Uncharacterized protein n=1 Tax=Beauveria bassiana D1-5 TaxID=1245745 RepID=A0A0A2V4M9_BEABA|nr:hypothetical protein BBAD15_g12054 [Beauveria bassiana D1-5]